FGFKSLKEEYEYLHAKLEISSELLVKEKPYFIFGRIKDDPETKDLIVKLEETQKSIQKLLASPNFLDEVLRQFEGDAKIINYIDTTHNELSELVAAHIWEAIKDEDEIYKDNFLLGMQGDRLKNIDELDFRKIQAIKRITNNLEKSALIFKNIKDHENYIVLLTDKLYYKILKTAPGETLNGSSRIKISYVIKDYENEIIAEKKHHICDLDELIPGFALGLIGMKKGEIREIVIHPCLSYGLETAFEKGVVLFKGRIA
ncbi:MAG: FKBP-type peptidyl-prolyl cis-trans isomerase, partial [Parachlamydiaceae bacterium]